MNAAIEAAATARRGAALDYLCALIRAGRAGEAAVQALVAERIGGAGAVETLRYHPGTVEMRHEFADPAAIDSGEREAVLVRRPGSGGGRSLILFAHPDSEPPSVQHWTHDPFEPALRGGRLSGWGVADDLAGIACMVEALKIVAQAGLTLRGDITLASTPSKRHARGVCALLARGLTADAAVYLHPAESGAGLREIKAFTSGQVEFKITVAGLPPPTTEPLPAAVAHRAVNPIEKAFVIHEALRRLDARRGETVHHPALHAAAGRSTNLMLSHISSGRANLLSQPGASCVLGGVLAFPPPESLEMVQAQIAATVQAAAASDPFLAQHPPMIEWCSGTTGAELPQDHPLYAAVDAVIGATTGSPPHVNALHTGSDIRHPMVQRNIPTVGLGPLGGNLAQNGGWDEWVDVADYLQTVKVVAGLMAMWCG